MNTMKRILAVLLVAAMVAGCCACGGSDSKTNNNPLEGNTYVAGFPIVKEKEKLEIMTIKQVNHGDFDEMGFTKYYEDMTNIDIEWMVTTEAEYDSNLTLMFQSKNLPDVISLPLNIFGSDRLLEYSKKGDIIQLNDLIDKYAPNIKSCWRPAPSSRRPPPPLTARSIRCRRCRLTPKTTSVSRRSCTSARRGWITSVWTFRRPLRNSTTC